MGVRLTTEQFITKSKLKHGDKYDYSLVDYTGKLNKVVIICPVHGEFIQPAHSHIRGCGCRKCSTLLRVYKYKYTTEEFIEKVSEIHNNKYDYSLTNYTGTDNNIKIICPLHGEFEQSPHSHIQGKGCSLCGLTSRIEKSTYTTLDFIKKAKEVHGDKYDYTLSKYVNKREKIKIICKIHGEFTQIPSAHLWGKGCKYCGNEQCGWAHDNWEIAGNNSLKFDGFKVYVMELKEADGTSFYKVGKTFKEIKERVNGIKTYKPINTTVIRGIASFCSKLEVMMHRALREYRYKPNIKFDGSTECFSYIPDDIFATLKSFTNT